MLGIGQAAKALVNQLSDQCHCTFHLGKCYIVGGINSELYQFAQKYS